jgi:predicted chitinase
MAVNKSVPYVGPRPFERADEALFYGREHEAQELLSLVISNPVLLLHSQSGAGKTSLINARLVPLLEQEDLEVVSPPTRNGEHAASPSARVSGRIPDSPRVEDYPQGNIYVFNALMCWKREEDDASSLIVKTLAEFFERAPAADAERVLRPRVIIFDQFEELFTSYTERWRDRQGFFKQVGELMSKDRRLRVIFSMREEYIAELDPFLPLLPDRLRRYRLDLLREGPAMRAVNRPLQGTGMQFGEDVDKHLVANLRKVPVKTTSGVVEIEGQFVEPVQLQVVCQRLWEKLLEAGETVITDDHLKTYGDVDQALLAFYERSLKRVLEGPNVEGLSEGMLRRWFEGTLITPAGTRGTIFQDETHTGGLPNVIVAELENQHILRAELRGGARWFELSHDRFIQPIKSSNRSWLLQLSTAEVQKRLEDKAALWQKNDLLLDDHELMEAERWLESPEAAALGYSDALQALVRASRKSLDAREAARRNELAHALKLAEERRGRLEAEQERAAEQQRLAEAERLRAEAQAKAARSLRLLLSATVVLLLLAVISAIVAVFQWQEAAKHRNRAVQAAGGREEVEAYYKEELARALDSERRIRALTAQQSNVKPITRSTDVTRPSETNRVDAATLTQFLQRISPVKGADFLPYLQAAMEEFGIDTPLRQAAFLAQIAHKSAGLMIFEENLNYSEEGLLNTWPGRFATEEAAVYARQPEKIANRVYADRLGNGPEVSGDGWRYRGRGYFQITGRSYYRQLGQELGLNLENNPDQAATPEVAFRVAAAFWKSRGLNELADKEDLKAINRRITGGSVGLEERQQYYEIAKEALGVRKEA